jgi:hypothetical protein
MENPMIYGAVIDAMGQISAIGKNKQNQTQGFRYRGIDDVMNELHGILAKCGIFIVPTVLEENRTQGTTSKGGTMFYTRLKIKFSFYAKDGSSIESVVIGEAMDSGDKASNKALSIGLKYALLQVFCIPTEDDKDPDNVSPDFVPASNPDKKVDTIGTPEENAERKELVDIVEKYEAKLNVGKTKPNAYDLCCNALAGNDPVKVHEMLGRAKAYLTKQGVAL